MDLILDSNQFIADLWLRSQRFQVLQNYLVRTQSSLLLLEPVFDEVKAHFSREVASQVSTIERAVSDLRRLGVTFQLPSLVDVVEKAVSEWESNLRSSLGGRCTWVPFDPSVGQEAFRRAASRLPPCKASGDGMRDAIIWLSALRASSQRMTGDVAFVSANTRDFAPEPESFHPALAQDLAIQGAPLVFFPSLEEFNRSHSDRISHITMDWVAARVSEDELQHATERYLSTHSELLRPVNRDARDHYEAQGEPYFHRVDVDLTDFYVWKLDADRIAISLTVGAYVEADVECYDVTGRTRSSWSPYFDDEERPRYQVFTCDAELGLDIAAEVMGDKVEVLGVDDVYRG